MTKLPPDDEYVTATYRLKARQHAALAYTAEMLRIPIEAAHGTAIDAFAASCLELKRMAEGDEGPEAPSH